MNEWIGRRDAAVTLIDRAWDALERGEPTAVRQCIAAMGLARDALVELGTGEQLDNALDAYAASDRRRHA